MDYRGMVGERIQNRDEILLKLEKERNEEKLNLSISKNRLQNNNAINIGIIGVGGWGKNHSRVLHDFGVLTSICDMDKTKAQDLANRYNVNYYGSIEDMINLENLDACLVCTPTKTHYQVSKKLMENGINVFVEKPLSYSSKECEEMIQIAKRNKIAMTCGYIERFNPAVQDVKKILSEETYGELLMIEFHRENRMPLHIKDVGIIYGDLIKQEITIEDSNSTTIPRRSSVVEPLSLELKNFIEVIEGKREQPEVSPEEATNVTKIAEAALLSTNTGAPIYLNLGE